MIFSSHPEEALQRRKVNKIHGIAGASHVYFDSNYDEPCDYNPLSPSFYTCGSPPETTPPEWLVARTIFKTLIICGVVAIILATTYIVMRITVPLRGGDSGPGPNDGGPPFPPIIPGDGDGGPNNSNPDGHTDGGPHGYG